MLAPNCHINMYYRLLFNSSLRGCKIKLEFSNLYNFCKLFVSQLINFSIIDNNL